MDSSTADVRLRYLPLLLTGMLVLGTGVAYALLPPFRLFLADAYAILTSDDEARISAWVSGYGWRGPLLLVLAMVAQIFLVVIPSWGLMVVSVLAFGPVWGTVFSLTGTMASAAVAYSTGHYLGDVVVEGLLGRRTLQKAEGWVREHGFWAVLLARISPVVSGDAVSLVCGITEMPFRRFLTATLVGAAPLALAIGFFGENTGRLKAGFGWVSAVSAVIFVVYLLWQRNRR